MPNKLTNEEEVLFRQVHPSFMENGEPSSQPFKPSPKDENKLSVDRSTIFNPQESFELYTVTNGYSSAAVYGIAVGEFLLENILSHEDPIEATETSSANPAHALADYSAHGSSEQKNIAKRLKRKALARGCLHKPS